MFLLGIALLCAETIAAEQTPDTSNSTATTGETEMMTSTGMTSTNGTPTNQATSSSSTEVSTPNAPSSNTSNTAVTITSNTKRTTSTSMNGIDGNTTISNQGPEKNGKNDESPTEKIG